MALFDFASIRRSVLGLEDQLKKMKNDILDLQRKREAMLSAPANKVDVKNMLSGWVRNSGEVFRQTLGVTLKDFVRNPRNMTPQRLAGMVSVAGAAQPLGDALRPKDVDQALCALFGPLLDTALLKQVDLLDWPDEGLPLAQRTIEAEKLNQGIAQLEKEYSDLIDGAESAGIVWSRT
jgi:hypothetical protein